MSDNELNNQDITDADIENVLKILENFGNSEEGRLKVSVADQIAEGKTVKKTHYGRCDVRSQNPKSMPGGASEEGC